MKIIIQAFKDDDEAKYIDFDGDTVARVDTFKEAHEAIDQMEKGGI